MIENTYIENCPDAKFSILIPTWNNLDFLKLCINSIRKNSYFNHQIIVHINEGADGTLDWVKKENLSYSYSKKNIGVCFSLNIMRTLISTDYIVFMNDDMYVCPKWDLELWNEIELLPNKYFFLSSTLLQPKKFWCQNIVSPVPMGENVIDFEEQELLEHYMNIPHGDWSGATWPPNIVHKDVWDLVGGYSIEFSPGMYSDPDFSAKLVLAGIKHFKGIDKSRVYHFEAKSTNRIKKNNGSKQFLFKWGITSSSFMAHILHRGKYYRPDNVADQKRIKLSVLKSKLKTIMLSFFSYGNERKIWKTR
jgi:glycosyltransferase involved in cell wall biosynthesis